ncbi:DUF2270 domain-containing protein [Vulgatibacter incomptus]|uniref:DUF2270 domain-containing protein n=1 Tax=Vulgatibacter incomptus TaxID=1391653 RepID=A0A0K1P8I9_9BACT|nr:DUF2270 domain-containing protein [Vulgatibacter incomptus]AKU89721.1 hypothetical protein AKJ08_0108 [Vulgatibacter incomptus]
MGEEGTMPEVGRRIAAKRPPGMSEVTVAHLYRAEVQRSTVWRNRLDTTTNWAVTTTAAVISFSFSNPSSPHPTILAGVFAVYIFLTIEARRYRYYDIWARRVRMFELGYFVPLARREPVPVDFYATLAIEFTRPKLRISSLQSLVFRLKRTYAAILGGLLGAWLVKLDLHPEPAETFTALVARARIGPIPGVVVCVAWLVFVAYYLWLLLVAGRGPLPSTELAAPKRKRRVPLAHIFRGIGFG